MRISQQARALLVAILADVEEVRSIKIPHWRPGTDRYEWACESNRLQAELNTLQTLGVRLSVGRWLYGGGTLSTSESSSAARTLKTMEAAGLVERAGRWERNCTHVKLTASGEELARRLAREESKAPHL